MIAVVVPRNCVWCGESFVPKNNHQRAKSCSRLCNVYQWKRDKRGVVGKHSEEFSQKMKSIDRTYMKGENNCNWKGGTTLEREQARKSLQYKDWRRQVFERDNYTCQFCGKRGGDLEADHIKPWADFIELRFELSNGRALCKPCHRTTFVFFGNKHTGRIKCAVQ